MHIDSDLVQRLILAGTAPDTEITALVKEVGLEAVVQVLVDEILFRCDEPVNATPVHIALDVTHETEQRRIVLRIVRDEPITVVDDEEPVIRLQLRMGVLDLVRRLSGRLDHRQNGDFFDSFLPTPPADMQELPVIVRSTNQATGTLLSGCTARCADLGTLSVRYGSDKWASFH
ncbi:MAG: class I SAM-dependent methyltransferase, partial [Pseudonocardiaceae bacterium]